MRALSTRLVFAAASGIAISAVFGGWSTAAAQDSEIIVTARKRAERVIEVPAAITAIGAEDIERRGGIPDSRAREPSRKSRPALGLACVEA